MDIVSCPIKNGDRFSKSYVHVCQTVAAVKVMLCSSSNRCPKRGAYRDPLGAAPDGDADALAGMLLAVLSLERLSQAQAAPEWLEEAMKPVVRSHCWR